MREGRKRRGKGGRRESRSLDKSRAPLDHPTGAIKKIFTVGPYYYWSSDESVSEREPVLRDRSTRVGGKVVKQYFVY